MQILVLSNYPIADLIHNPHKQSLVELPVYSTCQLAFSGTDPDGGIITAIRITAFLLDVNFYCNKWRFIY